MKDQIVYEWCIETYTADEYEDIIDNNFSESETITFNKAAFEANEGEATRLLLIRDEGNERDGNTARFWAYVESGKLPVYFSDELGREINIKVPQRFHKELERYYKTLTPGQ